MTTAYLLAKAAVTIFVCWLACLIPIAIATGIAVNVFTWITK